MRKAYIGLSSPIMYDYKQEASKAPSDLQSSPNPVLDSPFGIMLLFDELIFLCRSLCPENMRNLSYVRFLDEEGKLPEVKDLDYKTIEKYKDSSPILSTDLDNPSSERISYQELLKMHGVYWGPGLDNHTHGLKIGDITAGGNADLHNLIFDLIVIERIGDPNIELITNLYTQRYFEPSLNASLKSRLTELLIIKGIPNYLTPKGPYHPCIDEVRENQYLVDFRSWISNVKLCPKESELKEIASEIESQIQKAQDEIFLKYLNPKSHYKSIGKAAIGDIVGFFVPGISTLASAIEERQREKENINRRWQGFIISTRSIKL